MISVHVDGTFIPSSEYNVWSYDPIAMTGVVSFNNHLDSGSEVVIRYYTNDRGFKAFTFGTRRSNSKLGKLSSTFGNGNKASGNSSMAIGAGNQATGPASVAEGIGSIASGKASHAEGGDDPGILTVDLQLGTVASGDASHAQNVGTIASGYAQTAMGICNVSDPTKALIIGNGRTGYERSNCLTLDWDGNLFVGSTDEEGNPTSYGTINGVDVSRIGKGYTWGELAAKFTWGDLAGKSNDEPSE